MFEQLEQTASSYWEEAAHIYAQLENLYAISEDYVTFDPEGLIAQLEGAWRYARQRAEDLYASETAACEGNGN